MAIYDDIDRELKAAVEDVILNQNQGESGQEATEKLLEVAEKYRGQGGAQKADENLEWRNELQLKTSGICIGQRYYHLY